MGDIFKICPSCQREWKTQQSFILDEELELNGYSVDFEDLKEGLLFFTHKKKDCFSTLAMSVKYFINLYDGPFYPEKKIGAEACPGYCFDENQLERCDVLCEGAYVREIIDIIRKKDFETHLPG